MCSPEAGYLPYIARWGATGGPPQVSTEQTAQATADREAARDKAREASWAHRVPQCDHRRIHWRCGGECTAACELGLGQAGIVEEHDCQDCEHAIGRQSKVV